VRFPLRESPGKENQKIGKKNNSEVGCVAGDVYKKGRQTVDFVKRFPFPGGEHFERRRTEPRSSERRGVEKNSQPKKRKKKGNFVRKKKTKVSMEGRGGWGAGGSNQSFNKKTTTKRYRGGVCPLQGGRPGGCSEKGKGQNPGESHQLPRGKVKTKKINNSRGRYQEINL